MCANKVTLGVVMDPVGSIKPYKDSTFAMLLEAQARDWEIHYMEQPDLYVRDGVAGARAQGIEVTDNNQSWYTLGDIRDIALADLDVILMRKDPPFDMEYIYTTYILELAQAAGTLIVNRTDSLRAVNEKAYTAWFPDCCPPTLIARSKKDLGQFLADNKKIVVKPLDGMGGRSVFVVDKKDINVNVIFETITEEESRFVIAQRYIPEIFSEGDKRVLLVDGEPVPYALARIPAAGDSRGNIAAGARYQGQPLTDREQEIARRVGPSMKEMGLLFVGLDVIGDYMTEINITSPTCIRELDKAFDLNISALLFDAIEKRLTA